MFRATASYIKLSLFLALYSTSSQSAPLDFRLGANIATSSLSGSNSQSNLSQNFRSGSAILGIDFSVFVKKYFTGLGFSQGRFVFKNELPVHPSKTIDEVDAPSETTVTRGEIDVVLGYQVFSRFSFFFDYKFVNHSWSDDSKKLLAFRGPGFGGLANYPLTQNWFLFGSFGIGGLNPSYDGKQIGSGTIAMLKLGVVYRWNAKSILTLSYKTQTMDQKYSDDLIGDTNQMYKNVGVVFNFNRLI